jgi:hypothetical protein
VSESEDVTLTGFAQADKDEEGDHPRNMLDAMRRAVNEGGYKGLYKGMNVSLPGQALFSFESGYGRILLEISEFREKNGSSLRLVF